MDPVPPQHSNTMNNKEREGVSKGVLGLVVGLALMTTGIWGVRQLHIVWNIWPCTDGIVMRGAVQEVFKTPSAKGEMPIRSYAPKVEFRYRAGGQDYTTETLSVYIADTYEQAAASLARMYAPGTHHPIRYNPRNPRDIRFGIIDFGSLAFSFLLLFGGVALSVMGLNALVLAYPPREELAPAKGPVIPVTVLPLPERARQNPPAAMQRCPACGRPVKATEETCPNCLKFLRAA